MLPLTFSTWAIHQISPLFYVSACLVSFMTFDICLSAIDTISVGNCYTG